MPEAVNSFAVRGLALTTVFRASTLAAAIGIVLITLEGARPASGVSPGSNGLIVFVSGREFDDNNLWLVRSDGSGLRKLTRRKEFEWSPVWSPDGRRIAFFAQSLVDDDLKIFTIRGDGEDLRRLTPNRLFGSDPAWSPDGSRIVFVSALAGKRRTDLYVMNANGKERSRLTKTPSTSELQPAWSPDGTRIVFQQFCGEANCPLYTMSSSGRGAKRMVATGREPTWSPDGATIAFYRHTEFVVVDSVTGSETLLRRGPLSAPGGPDWAPDGSTLVFAENLQEDCGVHFIDQIQLVGKDGTGQRRLFPLVCEADDFDPAWQPICSHYGTHGNDVLRGTAGNDVICALGGNDRIAAFGGDDVIIGGDGRDVIFGGPGKDRLFGSAGDDKLFAKDGEAEDVTNGGPGRDVAIVDGPQDRRWEVERTVR